MAKSHRPRPAAQRSAAEELDAEAQVRLKPLLGVKPGAYLTVLYALAVLFALFMLLFSKGLRDRGTYVRVTTYPAGAAVSLDGTYKASTPCEFLVPRGPHTLTASKPYFTPAVLEEDFAGPVFGTRFVRPRREWSLRLTADRPAEMTAAAVEQFAAGLHMPYILRDAALAALSSPDAALEARTFVDDIKYFIITPEQTPDYVYAMTTAFSNGEVLSPASLLRTVSYLVQLTQKYENSPRLLPVLLPESLTRELMSTGWYADFLSRYRAYLEERGRAAGAAAGAGAGGVPTSAVTLQDLAFRAIPGGVLQQGLGAGATSIVQVPHPVAVPSFYMSTTEVTNRLYERFLDANPAWGKANLEELRAKGWADDGYLAGWQDGSYAAGAGDLPVTGVSFHAAAAFCSWLGRSLPASLAGYEARLPLESEWEWAARGGLVGQSYPLGSQPEGDVFFEAGMAGPRPAGSSAANAYGLRDMSGNVWEWCLDWYSPTKYLFTARAPEGNAADSRAEIPYGAQKVIRGGGWANEKELVKVFTRGSQPPDWCTPYLGFRVVLARTSP